MSCWWAATAVVLDYYDRYYSYPWEFRSVFARPSSRYGLEAVDHVLPPPDYPSIDEAMERDPTLRHAIRPQDIAPWMWYELGLPNTPRGLRRYCEITGFRGVPDCPPYGRWTTDDVERILRHKGLFVFFGFWSGFPHAIVVCGAYPDTDSVAFMDPAQGFVHSEAVATFNGRMSSMTIGPGAIGYNPVYSPRSNPVRATV
jgi:hypothetical protein